MFPNQGLDDPNSKTGKVIKYTWGFISFVVALATLYGIYLQVKENKPRVQISQNMVSHLTIPPRIAGLRATYYYRDSIVADLWKLDVVAANIGSETIIAVGPKRNIMSANGLEMTVRHGFKILDVVSLNGSLPLSIKVKNDSTIILTFEQWRKSEAVRIGLYLERETSRNMIEPILVMSDRQIIDGKVDNIPYRSSLKDTNPVLADYLPQPIKNPIRYSLIVIFISVGLIIVPAAAYSEIKGKEKKFLKTLPFVVLMLLFALPLLWLIHNP